MSDQTPRERAEEALTFLIHETGTAKISLSAIVMADVKVDLADRLADAIADAEEAATASLQKALHETQEALQQAKERLADVNLKDSIKTNEINILVREVKNLEARAEQAEATLAQRDEELAEARGMLHADVVHVSDWAEEVHKREQLEATHEALRQQLWALLKEWQTTARSNHLEAYRACALQLEDLIGEALHTPAPAKEPA